MLALPHELPSETQNPLPQLRVEHTGREHVGLPPVEASAIDFSAGPCRRSPSTATSRHRQPDELVPPVDSGVCSYPRVLSLYSQRGYRKGHDDLDGAS